MAGQRQSGVLNNRQRATHSSDVGNGETTGVIKTFLKDRGFGFIKATGVEQRVFFHRAQLKTDVAPIVGNRVHFLLKRNKKGLVAEAIENEDE